MLIWLYVPLSSGEPWPDVGGTGMPRKDGAGALHLLMLGSLRRPSARVTPRNGAPAGLSGIAVVGIGSA